MKLHIEIRPGEGGQDARLLVETQAKVYLRYAERRGVTMSVAEATSS